ncbi:hypothetical protein E2C01_065649 [Portunus trituberculatus]|uniref:Uncharacterized protein n=1 Tax=Portunus trituberculatus TaxID=210409 RepID=A0A5B7HJE3_PORTR|nr:hypothetical protein [Portunus trituberculatus]
MGRQARLVPWHPKGLHGWIFSTTGSGSWQEARQRLESRPRPLPPTLVVAVDIFYRRGCKPHPNQLGQP